MSELAKKDIPDSAREALLAAVYLVAKIEGDNKIGQATAWAFSSDKPGANAPETGTIKLATNAHVTAAIKDHEDEFVLIGPNGDVIRSKRR